ncbi:MAG: sensor histidine kinase [Acidimicrobiia bacterium]
MTSGEWRFRPWGSIRARITLAAVVVVGFALAVAAAGLVSLVHRSLVANLDETAEVLADDVAARYSAGTLPPSIPISGGADDDDLIIQVVDARGRVVAASENYLSQPPILTGAPDDDGRLRATAALPTDPEERIRITGRRLDTDSGGQATVFVANEYKPVERTENAVRRAVWFGAPALLALVAAFVWILVGRALRPVESIRRQVAAISESDLDRRVPEPDLGDEVGRLARTMNAMLERLQRAAERQRRFVSDASHELRSPLAATRTTLEVALTHPESTTLEATATDALAEAERMERLIADLLFLARGDEGRPAGGGGAVDVDDVVRAEVARVRSRGRVAVDASGVDPGRVWGVAGHLEQAVRNLLENAERHARSAVSVSLSNQGSALVLEVTDDGPGVPAEDRERIFDRFVRLDEARGRDAGGAGLGLAITREIVVAHGGSVGVDDAPGGGARFVVRLPVARPE